MDAHEKELLEKEGKYCSQGDTVHYLEPPKFFERCEGSYLFDRQGVRFLDLQMWYSAASFGYANKRLGDALKSRSTNCRSWPASTYMKKK